MLPIVLKVTSVFLCANLVVAENAAPIEEEKYGVKYASECEGNEIEQPCDS